MALVSLVHAARQWFKSRQGLDVVIAGKQYQFKLSLRTETSIVSPTPRSPEISPRFIAAY